MNKAKILVADHDPKFSRLLAAILNYIDGYEARQENCSSRVIETAREFRPRLIILNVNVDEGDNRALASAIRSVPTLEKTPIIFVTKPNSGEARSVPQGVLSMSRYATPRHFLNLVRAACPRVDPDRGRFHHRAAECGARNRISRTGEPTLPATAAA